MRTDKLKHTPGPWEVTDRPDEHDDDKYFNVQNIVDGESDWVVARVWADVSELSAEANAHLIAAAPDLLVALEACRDRLEALQDAEENTLLDDAAWQQACSAILKATGRE